MKYWGQSSPSQSKLFIDSVGFPWSKPEAAKEWKHAMHRKGFTATIHSRVCSSHFTPDCFDRSGLRVQLKAGAVLTMVNLPSHLENIVDTRNAPTETYDRESKPALEASRKRLRDVLNLRSHPENIVDPRNSPTETNDRELTEASNPAEHSHEPALEASHKRLRDVTNVLPVASDRNSNTAVLPTKLRLFDGHNYSLPVASCGTSNMTVPPSKLRSCDGHNYSLPSPKVLKHTLSRMESALAKCKHKVKIKN